MTKDLKAQIGYVTALPELPKAPGMNPRLENLTVDPYEVTIRDMRAIPASEFSLDGAGFTLLRHDAPAVVNDAVWEGNRKPNQRPFSPAGKAYLKETTRFICELTGAREAFSVDAGALLSRISKKPKPTDTTLPTAHLAHLDFTRVYAENLLRWAVEERTHAPHSRFAIYQTWRPFSKAPQDNSLTLCDGRTVNPEKLFPYYNINGPEDDEHFVTISRAGIPDPAHRWYYVPDMTIEEVLVFKGFDSADVGGASTNAMHTAFDNPLVGSEAEPRRSVETRIIALFD